MKNCNKQIFISKPDYGQTLSQAQSDKSTTIYTNTDFFHFFKEKKQTNKKNATTNKHLATIKSRTYVKQRRGLSLGKCKFGYTPIPV